MTDLELALSDVCAAWPALQPPNRMRVSEGAAQNLRIARPGGASGYWNPNETPYLIEPVDMLGSRRHAAVCFVGPAQSGKALDVDTPIATPAGWTTMGALSVGDVVFDRHGQPTPVVFATDYQYGRECFRVEFSDGSSVVADADHLWAVERYYWRLPHWRSETLTTRQIAADLRLGSDRFRYRIPLAGALACGSRALPIDPYLLGVWLGDGVARQACVSAHVDDAPHYMAAFEAAGHTATSRVDGPNTVALQIDRRTGDRCARGHDIAAIPRGPGGECRQCDRLKYRRKRYGGQHPPGAEHESSFTGRLRRGGLLRNKHIPAEYLRGSTPQRWALLRGLMDTDGTCSAAAASAEFTTTLPSLKDGVTELLCSLGLKPTVRTKATAWSYRGERKTGTAFRVTFPIPQGVELFSLPRKVERVRTTTHPETRRRAIVAIEPVESRPVKCIQVAAESHTYLAGERMVPTHNTVGLGEGWMAHAVVNDPGDMLIVQMTQDKAREYSKQRIDRAIRNSPTLWALRGASSRDDNLHDKQFRNGMWVRLAWPTPSNLSSTSYRYVFLTDYDRVEDDIGGEGDMFSLGLARTRTFLSRGMLAVESSPGRPVVDPSWKPSTPHEAPPTKGILGIYNRSDRRRWMWKCPHCADWLEAKPGLALFNLPPDDELIESVRALDIDAFARDYARAVCPTNGCLIGFEHRERLNRTGRWLQDGLVLDDHDRVSGNARESSIAGYWLGGAAATYITWETLLRKHLQALLEYALNGSELALQTTVNTDQGMPYTSRHLAEAASVATDPATRTEDHERYIVPDAARFLIASVDVQGGKNARFEVQVHAIGEHQEEWLVDRYPIKQSKREGMGDEFAPIDPATHPEDWDLITEKVVNATYRTNDPDREMRVKLTVVDSGGEDGVTDKAYAWYRRVRQQGLQHRVRLVKGASGKDLDWYTRETMVGAQQGQGDVPLYLLNPNKIKDVVAACLKRRAAGPGYYHFPKAKGPKNPQGWLPPSFFDELSAEVRNERGVWEQIRLRNESLDLCCYIKAGGMMLGVDRKGFWDAPPRWARPHAENSEVISPEARREMRAPAAVVPVRRSRPSAYLS